MDNYLLKRTGLRRTFAAVLMALCATSFAFASDFVVEGIHYNIFSGYWDNNQWIPAESNEVYVSQYEDGIKYMGDIVIPEKIQVNDEEYTVTRIGGSAFSNCEELNSVQLPQTIKCIENSAFAYCQSLISINLPDAIISIGSWAFSQSGLKELSLPSNLNKIESYTFYNCTSLTTVILPDGLISIEERAFAYCNNLKEINLPESINSIGDYVFSDCNNLKEINLPQKLNSIGEYAFSGCGLKNIELPNSLTVIAAGAFAYCQGLGSGLVLPENIVRIGNYAFIGIRFIELKSLNPEPPAIGRETFGSSSKLEVPDADAYRNDAKWSAAFQRIVESPFECDGSVYAISSKTNHTCSLEKLSAQNMATLRIPEMANINGEEYTIDYLGDDVLTENTGIETLIIPGSFNSVPNDGACFNVLTNLKYLILEDSETELNLGSSYNFENCPIDTVYLGRNISSFSLRESTTLTKVSLGDNVTYIVDWAFYNCTSLKAIHGKNVSTIGDWAFSYCNALTSGSFGDSLKTIGAYAFYCCSNIKEFVLPETIESIGDYAFQSIWFNHFKSLSTVPPTIGRETFSSSLKLEVPDADAYRNDAKWGTAFQYIVEPTIEIDGSLYAISSKTNHTCSLEKLSAQNEATLRIPETVTINGEEYTINSLGDDVLTENTGIETLIIPGSINTVSSNGACFKDLTNLKYFILEDSETELNLGSNSNFENCPIDSVYLGRNISSSSFRASKTLTKVSLGDSVTYVLAYAFDNCTSLKAIHGKNVSTIGDWAFGDCRALTSVFFGDSLKTIGAYAFYCCYNIKELTLPETIDSIGDYAFLSINFNCLKSLSTVPPTIGRETFSSSIKLEVPDADAYRNDEKWDAAFQYIVEPTIEVDGSLYAISSKTNHTCRLEKLAAQNLTEIRIPETVNIDGVEYTIESFGNDVLTENIGVETLIIPGSFNSVPSYGACFSILTNLKNLTIEDSKTELNIGTLENCPLETVYMGRNIPERPFSQKETLTSVTIGSDVTYISYEAFANCRYLSKVDGAEHVDSIGAYAFYQCVALKSAEFKNVKTIDNYAFSYCENLESIKLSNEVSKIGESAFSDCWHLRQIDLPESLTEIGEYALSWCSGLTGVLSIPTGIKTITSNSFSRTGYTVCEIPSTEFVKLVGTERIGNVETIIVPSDLASTYRDSNWGEMYDFISNSGITVSVAVTTPGNLAKDIVSQARKAPASVNKLIITGGRLGEGDFKVMKSNMTACFEIDMSAADCDTIYANAFNGKQVLKSIILPDKASEIGENAFENCTILESVVASDSLQNVGSGAFYGCKALRTVDLGDNVRTIGSEAFMEDYNLINFRVPSALTSIGNAAFYNASKLDSIILGDEVKEIGSQAFYGCSSLAEFSMPNTITAIGSGALSYTAITDIDMSEFDSLTYIPASLFNGCTQLQSIGFPRNISSIGSSAFSDCTKLTDVNLKETGIAQICSSAFSGCSKLASVTLPESVTDIADGAFAGCRKLRAINVAAATPPTVYKTTFKNVSNEVCTLSIPTSAFEDYLLAQYWGSFVDLKSSFDIVLDDDSVEIAYEIFDSEEEAQEEVADTDVNGGSVEGEDGNEELVNAGEEELPESEVDNAAPRRVARANVKVANANTVTDGISLFVNAEKTVRFHINSNGLSDMPQVLLNGEDISDQVVNGYLVLSNFNEINTLEVKSVNSVNSVKLGDANEDGTVDIEDAVLTVSAYLDAETIINREAANVKADDIIDISDVVGIVDIYLINQQKQAMQNERNQYK